MPPLRSSHHRTRERAPLSELPISHFLHTTAPGLDSPTKSGNGGSPKGVEKAGTNGSMGGSGNTALSGLMVPFVVGTTPRPSSPLKPRPSRGDSDPTISTSSSISRASSSIPFDPSAPSSPSASTAIGPPKTPRTDRTLRHRLLSAAGQEQAALLLARDCEAESRSLNVSGGRGASGSGSGSKGRDKFKVVMGLEDVVQQEPELGTRSPARRLFLDEMHVADKETRVDDGSSHPALSSIASPGHPTTNAREKSNNAKLSSPSMSTSKTTSLAPSRRLRLAPSPPIDGCFGLDNSMDCVAGRDTGSSWNVGKGKEMDGWSIKSENRMGPERDPSGDVGSPTTGPHRRSQTHDEYKMPPTTPGRSSLDQGGAHACPSTTSNKSTSTRKVSARTHAERASPTNTPRASKKSKMVKGGASPAAHKVPAVQEDVFGSPRSSKMVGGGKTRSMGLDGNTDVEMRSADLHGSDGNSNADPYATGFEIWCDESGGMYASAAGSGGRLGQLVQASGNGPAYGSYSMSAAWEDYDHTGLWNAVASTSSSRPAEGRAGHAGSTGQGRPGSSVAAEASPSGSSIFKFDFDNQENQAPEGWVATGAEKAYFAIQKQKNASTGSSSSSAAASSNPSSPSDRRPTSATGSTPTGTGSPSSSASIPSRLRSTPHRINHCRSLANMTSRGGFRGEAPLSSSAPGAVPSIALDENLTPGRSGRLSAREAKQVMSLEADAGI